MCHNKPTTGAQYKQWSTSKHANAYNVLSDAEKKDAKCLKCHTTSTLDPTEGVSCESCHGAGSKYKSPAIMKDHAKSMLLV